MEFSLAPGQSVAGTNYDWDPNYRNIQLGSSLNPLTTGEAQSPLDVNRSMLWFFNFNLSDTLPQNHPHYQQWIQWLNQWVFLARNWNYIPETTRMITYADLYRRYTEGNTTPPYGPVGYHRGWQEIINYRWPEFLATRYNKDMTGSCIYQFPNTSGNSPCYYGSGTPSQ